ncbi:NAD(P)-dependent alcohol dehydrogenase [Marivibrio halodurans]|uniref:NAD(P)-dependent alcohol dehydrogenase n=1 Tax=Marivibrio halodurans TaxID=2039722 RepID=A0A8J7S0C6_9PROT|nr:NAD(P)-dependent alcohol dehydrogenase [Marivibrio halodurans]MBP5856364.1 NAD(P)-dependent alcohol dehydrogenase [Marivibrio halodurans]
MMKAMRLEEDFGLENIRYRDLPDPEPGPGEVVIAIEAVAINPRDRLMMLGGYGRMGGRPPLIPLCDGAGRIAAVGPGVDGVREGDFVFPHYSRTWPRGLPDPSAHGGAHGGPLDGTMRALMPVPATAVVQAPVHLTAAEAAALPCAGVTAWSAVVEQARIKTGQRVLIQGTGAISLFALQFAKLQGAEVVLISSSDEKLERARALGADHLINYRDVPDWHKPVREMTAGLGVDHVVDVGGAATLENSIGAVRTSGSISLIGVLGGSRPPFDLGRVVTRNIRLQGVTVGGRDMAERMAAAVAFHRMRPALEEKRFAFRDLAGALDALPEGRHFGKVVCEDF